MDYVNDPWQLETERMYVEAEKLVREAGRAQTSFLQRKLRIGYSRAALLMDMLEENGVVGPADGAKPREVLPAPKEKETSPSESTTTHSHTLPAGTDQVLIQVEGEKVTYQINPEHP